MTTRQLVESARSLLFVPGSRPERFGRARDSGADLIIIDLEDAVAPADKSAALRHAQDWLEDDPSSTVVRINGVGTERHADEVHAFAASGVAVMLPKCESATELSGLVEALSGSPVVALLETPRGVLAADAIAGVAGVDRLAFGNVDLAAALGVDPSSQTALWHARSHLVMTCAANGVAGPVDGVTTTLDDPHRLAEDVRHAVDLGFTAKLCIHPRQVAEVHTGLQPASADVDWAERVVAAAGGGAVAVDGEMVDGPVILRARTILARAGSPSFD